MPNGHDPYEHERRLLERLAGSRNSFIFKADRRRLFGAKIQQSLADLLMFDELFDCHTVHRVVELGTGTGLFTLWLGMQGHFRAFHVHSWDVKDRRWRGTLEAASPLPVSWYTGDVIGMLEDGTSELVWQIGKPGRTLVLCDNGHKPTELERVLVNLKPGDIAGVHDYGTEIYPRQIDAILKNARDILNIRMTPWTVRGELVFDKSRWRFYLRERGDS